METLREIENLSRQTTPLRIMIVEGNAHFQSSLKNMFERSGFKDIRIVEDSSQAFACVEYQSDPYDIVILDADSQSKEMPASTLCHFIRGHADYAESALIVLGSDLDRASLGEYFRHGADDVLQKPVASQTLELIAWQCLRRRRQAVKNLA